MGCTIFTTWGEPFHAVDKTIDEVAVLAAAGKPFEFQTDTLPGNNSRVWIRSAAVGAVVEDEVRV